VNGGRGEHVLRREQFVPRPLPEVFAFFADARNLERITPAFLRFRILPPLPREMGVGAILDHRLRLLGIPLRWTSRIDAWEPGRRFVDVQVRGPYALWVHEHRFRDVPGGTVVEDEVRYRVPLGPLGALARVLFVRRALDRIFDHRRAAVAARLGGPPAAGDSAAPPGAGA
jgi:hypothetical protein